VNENGTEKKLSTAQYRAIASLLTKGSAAGAAIDAGISRSTLYRWQHEPLFVAALRDAEQEAVEGLALTQTLGKPVRWFSGYTHEGRYYETGSSPVDYRNGINNAPEPGRCFSKADLASIAEQWQVNVIEIQYVDRVIEDNQQGQLI
jgi:hypothetical protein